MLARYIGWREIAVLLSLIVLYMHHHSQCNYTSQSPQPRSCVGNHDNAVSIENFTVTGKHLTEKRFLTIGIPTIKRKNGMEYLMHTLDSVAMETTMQEKNRIVVVIFLADFDDKYNKEVTAALLRKYEYYFGIGLFQIIQVHRSLYPPLNNLKQNFGDEKDRVKWRAKQVVDYAFLALYAQHLSEYFLQLEDDVTCSPHFVHFIENFIKAQTLPWVNLDFSELGFIGKLFKSEDLEKYSKFMLLFYDQQPVDLLIISFRTAMAQGKPILRKPTLFQHVGKISSLQLKSMKPDDINGLQDVYYKGNEGIKHRNPDAVFVTNFEPIRGSMEAVYTDDTARKIYWVKNLSKKSRLYIIFKHPKKLKGILINTGNKQHPTDKLIHADIHATSDTVTLNSGEKELNDLKYEKVASFQNGQFDINDLEYRLPFVVSCLRIGVAEEQENWVMFTNFKIFVSSF